MIRAIVSVVVGYLVMALILVVVFGVVMVSLGPEGTYTPGTYWTTGKVNAIVLVGGTVGAVAGGFACALIARSLRPLFVLAGIVLVFGLVSAGLNMAKPDPAPPTGAPTFEEGMTRGKQPNWFALAVALTGPTGLLVGGRLRGRGAARPSAG